MHWCVDGVVWGKGRKEGRNISLLFWANCLILDETVFLEEKQGRKGRKGGTMGRKEGWRKNKI